VRSKKEIIGSELMKEVISIRADTLWRMLALRKSGLDPKIDDEGATGDFDNKGAIFVPGGLVFEDSGRNPIKKSKGMSGFGARIRDAMKYDNATLLFPDGIATGISLDNGFFADMASLILASKKAVLRRTKAFGEPPGKFSTDKITKSYSPIYIKQPYGSRTKLSSCLAVCMIEAMAYYVQGSAHYNLRAAEQTEMFNGIKSALKPIVDKNNHPLAYPHIVVCHDTRYRKGIYTGVTRILGYGGIGEFATFTLESATSELLQECGVEEPTQDELFAVYEGRQIVGVLRMYPKTEVGNRDVKKRTAVLVSPAKDLGIDLEKITKAAMERYGL